MGMAPQYFCVIRTNVIENALIIKEKDAETIF
jgi:hypothetical protein